MDSVPGPRGALAGTNWQHWCTPGWPRQWGPAIVAGFDATVAAAAELLQLLQLSLLPLLLVLVVVLLLLITKSTRNSQPRGSALAIEYR